MLPIWSSGDGASHLPDPNQPDNPRSPIAVEARAQLEPTSRLPAVTTLVSTAPPPPGEQELSPEQLEFYVRSAIHQDRTPGALLIVRHPAKEHKVPRGLFQELADAGFEITAIDTLADRLASIERIRDALRELAAQGKPLDVLVVSGDGSLDHHVLVAAFWAFYPQLVTLQAGVFEIAPLSEQERAGLPDGYWETFFASPPDAVAAAKTEEALRDIWRLRSRLERTLARRAPVEKVLRRARKDRVDAELQYSVASSLFPHRVTLRPRGLDLSGLAAARREQTFHGLYPFVRSICTYPAGTAADNAVFAGVPGWGYALWSGLLTCTRLFDPLRTYFEQRLLKAFMRYYTQESVVVPARFSVVGLDGAWQRLSSHAAGGPGAGHFFAADLASKTRGLLGYLKRIPKVIFQEGILGSTVVRVRSLDVSGRQKSLTEGQMAEGLYTNRTFIAGVGSVPTTDPTCFAGQSSLVVIPPIWFRTKNGLWVLNFTGLAGFLEAIFKGVLGRVMHVLGLDPGTMAGGGKFQFLMPEHQVAIKEGETIEIDYMSHSGASRIVPIQISGDPFQAHQISIRAAWGPLPLLARNSSLLLAATRRSLANLRLQQSYRLRGVYIGGVYYFRHHSGEEWLPGFIERTGLVRPPEHLSRNLVRAQQRLLQAWQEAGAGEFVDTTQSGLALIRRGRYAHNNDQSAHLLVVRQPHGMLLVRQVRSPQKPGGEIYENRSYYRTVGRSFIIYSSQTLAWRLDEPPVILQEDHFFKDAESFQQEASTFFPVVARSPEAPTLLPRHSPTTPPAVSDPVRLDKP